MVKYAKPAKKDDQSFIKDEGIPAPLKSDPPISLIKEYDLELDKLIQRLLKRIGWLLKKLENLQDDLAVYNRSALSISHLVASLAKLFALKGIEFSESTDEQDILALLNRLKEIRKMRELTPEVQKKVEEVIKDLAGRKRS